MAAAWDVLVIGSGTAGQTAAHDLAEKGLKVAVVEHSDRPGGTCALKGCQAKKWFYEGAETVARSRHLQGIGVVSPAAGDWRALRDAKNRFTGKVPEGTVKGLKAAGIDLIKGRARFVDGNTLAVGSEELSARHIVVATGAAPMALPIDGMAHAMDSDRFLELDALPGRIVFIGGGFISFEFAHFAARLGPAGGRITLLEAAPRPLGPFDEEMVAILSAASADEGIDIHCGVTIQRIEKNGGAFTVHTEGHGRFEADMVVHGAGRSPDIEDLGLDRAGIAFDRKGIRVDPHMSTTNPDVFAVGDCAATIQLARVADAEAHVAAAGILAKRAGKAPESAMDYSVVPSVLFTFPQYAMVGKTEAALKEEKAPYKKSFAKDLTWPTYRRVGLSRAGYKILAAPDGQLLGAHVISDCATGIVNTFALAMRNRITVSELHRQSVMTPYPSRESDVIYMLKPLLDEEDTDRP